jgi:cysteinyl-tRNA synthetase
MSLRVFNTMAGKKETFIPGTPNQVRMYVCGPTTYNYIHLGNARALVVFDTVRRYLEYKGYHVFYVQNFTDIDNKIINRAAQEHEEPLELSARYINEYFRDADALRVMHADIHPKASEHIPEMLEMVKGLYDQGVAYQVDGDVYFSVRQFPSYGKLSGRTLDDMQAGARVDVDERKHDPMDFVLWKAAKPGEPSWDSPWGKGRPGWHLECSVMSLKYLGNAFDIHGGGSDLIFPHHENEIAQAEAYTGQLFARYWIHNGFVTVNEEKMSKSQNNFFIVRDLLQEWHPEVLRFFLLSTHYRSPLDYSQESLTVARKSYNRLRNTVELLDNITEGRDTLPAGRLSKEAVDFRDRVLEHVTEFEEAMDDDFNTALALASLYNMGREINTFVNQDDFQVTPVMIHTLVLVRQHFTRLLEILGLVPGEFRCLSTEYAPQIKEIIACLGDTCVQVPSPLSDEPNKLLDTCLYLRQEARSQKDYRLSDKLRDALKEIGIIIEDTPRGMRWRLV